MLVSIPQRYGDTHTLRGPRQAGKTTTVKRLIQRLVNQGESRILYYAFDPGGTPHRKRLHPNPEGPWYLFLDEITSVPDWQVGIKAAWDSGLTAEDSLGVDPSEFGVGYAVGNKHPTRLVAGQQPRAKMAFSVPPGR